MVAVAGPAAFAVAVDCPVCDRPLPPVMVDVATRSSGRAEDGGMVLDVSCEVRPLDAQWWRAAREAHPTCIPERPKVRDWQ